MPYTVKRKILNLQFADEELEGLEVRAHSVSFGKLLEVADQAQMMREKAGLSEVRGLLEMFANALVSWNAQDEDGQPIPATMDGMLDQDVDWVLTVVLAWFDAMVSVPDPLERKSTSGKQYPEVSIPMDVPSLSQENLQRLGS